jgi:HK97 family phage prohead protease
MEIQTERRAFPIELRVEGDEKPKIRGYAAVFNKMSDNLGGFREKIAPGAFKRTLNNADVRALFNHDPNVVLGRTGAGTLTLREDDKGLWMEIEPPDTADARDLMTLIERGDVDQASFAFRVLKDTWKNEESKEPIRTLDEVQLFDVSPVTYPAYPQTSVDVRERLTPDGQFTVTKTYPGVGIHSQSDPQDHSLDPAASHSGDSAEHSENDPEKVHSEPVKPRKLSVLAKEWRLEVEAGH